MENETQDFIKQFTTIPWIAAVFVVVAIVVGLAKFTDALKKLHDFGKTIKKELGFSSERKQQFANLRRNVLYCQLINELPVHLHQLRNFFIETGLVEKPHVREFFDKWLVEPPILTGKACVGLFSKEQLRQLTDELQSMRL